MADNFSVTDLFKQQRVDDDCNENQFLVLLLRVLIADEKKMK